MAYFTERPRAVAYFPPGERMECSSCGQKKDDSVLNNEIHCFEGCPLIADLRVRWPLVNTPPVANNWCSVHQSERSKFTTVCVRCTWHAEYDAPCEFIVNPEPISMEAVDQAMRETFMPELKAQLQDESWLLSRAMEDKSKLGIRTRIKRKVRGHVFYYRQKVGYRAFRILTGHDVPDEYMDT